MRARNREINIFNMSLLDILTGMLGAFLFLMLGLVPYYSKVVKGAIVSKEDQQRLEQLKKMLDQNTPLTSGQIEELKGELQRLSDQNNQLRAANDQLNSELSQAKTDLKSTQDERDFYRTDRAIMSLTSVWGTDATDVDVMVKTPSGQVFAPKKQKLFGHDIFASGEDSHGIGKDGKPFRTLNEGIIFPLREDGDYLVFYRIPPNADPASYASLFGTYAVRDLQWEKETSGNAISYSDFLPPAHANIATSPGLWAWTIFNYDTSNRKLSFKNLPPNLPDGIRVPKKLQP